MRVDFYQVPVLFVYNSSYLGDLISRENRELNVDLNDLENIKLLLSSSFRRYNYIKVTDAEGRAYYYILKDVKYYNHDKDRFSYQLDAVRTLKDMNNLFHQTRVSRYSGLLNMSSNANNYFWRNQSVKLGANIRLENLKSNIKYSDNTSVQEAWSDLKWIYIWLQPRLPQGEPVPHQYKLNVKNIKQYVEYSTLSLGEIYPPLATVGLNGWVYSPSRNTNNYFIYEVGQLYKNTTNGRVYKCTSFPRTVGIRNTNNNFPDIVSVTVKMLVEQADYEYDEIDYYFSQIPSVEIPNSTNNLYCMVLPTREIKVRSSGRLRSWFAGNIIPSIITIGEEESWNNYIVDIKISNIPPIDMRGDKISNVSVTTDGTLSVDFLGSPVDLILHETTRTVPAQTDVTRIFFSPFLRNIPALLQEMVSPQQLPAPNKENIVYKKHYLAVTEQRVELDIALLNTDKAYKLYYFEDILPGRSTIMLGYAPELTNLKDVKYYLLHSPNTLMLTRDNSLPIFTSQYQSYLANNKNFMQQAELQRQSQFDQQLVQGGAAALGSGLVTATVGGYSPFMAIVGAGGSAVSALIAKNAQEKQFKWGIDNMKAAPGNYKAANATLNFMMSLDILDTWIEIYNSNEFDISIYEQLVNDLGYEYFEYEYDLSTVIADAETVRGKKFLQGSLTGITSESILETTLLMILLKYLEQGVNLFT